MASNEQRSVAILLFGTKAAARRMGIDPATVTRLVRRGELKPSFKRATPQGSDPLFSAADLAVMAGRFPRPETIETP